MVPFGIRVASYHLSCCGIRLKEQDIVSICDIKELRLGYLLLLPKLTGCRRQRQILVTLRKQDMIVDR